MTEFLAVATAFGGLILFTLLAITWRVVLPVIGLLWVFGAL